MARKKEKKELTRRIRLQEEKIEKLQHIIDKSENWAEKSSVIAQKMLIEIVQEHIKKEDYSNLKKFCDDYLDSLNKNLEKY